MNKSVTSGQATVKRDLVVAPGRRGEAVCPLNALLQSQQPHPNSLSLVCTRQCCACQTTSSSIPALLEAESPLHTLVCFIHQRRGNICQSAITNSFSKDASQKCTTFMNTVRSFKEEQLFNRQGFKKKTMGNRC